MSGARLSSIHKIEVRSVAQDGRAHRLQKSLDELFNRNLIAGVRVSEAYTIQRSLTEAQLLAVAGALSNPVTQVAECYTGRRRGQPRGTFDWSVEIGFLPGVTDNAGQTGRQSIQDLLGVEFEQDEAVFTSQILFITGQLSRHQAEMVAAKLANPLIQRFHIFSAADWAAGKAEEIVVPAVRLKQKPKVSRVNLAVADDELKAIGQRGIADADGGRRGPLALNLGSMKAIAAHFAALGRQATDIELESIAQTWSEHCKHTIFADPLDDVKDGIYKTYIKAATERVRREKGADDGCVSVFTDNSGAIAFDDEWLVTHKVETHNSPSALDPFGGSITGIVGVNRDTIGFGLGAKPVANMYGFCLGDPRDEAPLYRDAALTSPTLLPRRILDGVVAGVNTGGNQSGIPTPQGFLWFDDRYKGKPLVFVGTVGLIPRVTRDRVSHTKRAQAGDLIVMVGGRVGLDGVHGATFSSEALSEASPATAVQIGDPITQKKLSDAIVKEARDLGLYTSITDNGAGGLSCSVAEMAQESGGFEVLLEQVPLKYPNLEPWQIWVSESQERMTLSVPPDKWPAFAELMERRGVEATVIGTFTDTGRCVVRFGGEAVLDLDLEFLHNGLPKVARQSEFVPRVMPEPERPAVVGAEAADGGRGADWSAALAAMLARPNLASFSFISDQYDHEVQAGSVLKPLAGRGRVNTDSSVVRPVLSSHRGVALSQGLYPTYSEIDPYAMAGAAIDTAIRNLVAVGADLSTIAILDNFCWCDSNNPLRLGQLKEAARACYDYAVAYRTPFISGKDSMFNDFRGFDADGQPVQISIPPTLLVSSIGLVENVGRVVSMDLKAAGDAVYLLGETHDELGGSEYFGYLSGGAEGTLGSGVPQVDAYRNRRLYEAVAKTIRRGLVASSVSVNRGGLAVALARTAMAGRLGLNVAVGRLAGAAGGTGSGGAGSGTASGAAAASTEAALFGETQGRIVVSVAPENEREFAAYMAGQAMTRLGTVSGDDRLRIAGSDGRPLVNLPVVGALKAYRGTFGGF